MFSPEEEAALQMIFTEPQIQTMKEYYFVPIQYRNKIIPLLPRCDRIWFGAGKWEKT